MNYKMATTVSRRPFTYALAIGLLAALLTYYLPRLGQIDYDELLRVFQGHPTQVDWATRQDHYPVRDYIPIPDATRKSLPRIQHQFKPEPQSKRSAREQRQKEVRLVVERSWRSYKKHGFPRDELKSISGTAHDTYGNWALTLVESLDTLWIAGLKDEFKEAVELVPSIDFNVTISQEGINVYEVTSRFLGGLLSAYELSWKVALKDKALELATILYAAFDTLNRMPRVEWDMMATKAGTRQQASESAAIGDIGGLALELTRLALLTKDPKWYDAAARIMSPLARQQDHTSHPGLFPVEINPQQKDLKSAGEIHLGPESQALYSTLPSMYALLRGSDFYKSMSKSAADSIIQNLLFRPMIPPGNAITDILLPGTIINGTIVPQIHHTACSIAGTLAYTGRLLRNETYITTAEKVLQGCLWASRASPLGIMPETFSVVPCHSPNAKDCTWDEETYNTALLLAHNEPPSTDPRVLTWKHRLPQGFTSITSRHYTLHHSLISSLFTLYRITGDENLREEAYQLWKGVYGRSKTKFAHAVIEDVTLPKAPKVDLLPCGWMGASLKYWYLMFEAPEENSLERWGLGTEGHFVRLGR